MAEEYMIMHVTEDEHEIPSEFDLTKEEANEYSCNYALWAPAQTEMLIALYRKYKPLVENGRIKTMKTMWHKITQELHAKHFIYSPTQVESKWKSLERAFRKKNRKEKQETGRTIKRSCPFEKELKQIITSRGDIEETPSIEKSLIIEDSDDDFDIDYELKSVSSEVAKPCGKCATKELKILADAVKQRTKLAVYKEKRKEREFKQRERLIDELKRKNDILQQFVHNKIQKN